MDILTVDVFLGVALGAVTGAAGRIFYDVIMKAKSLLPISNSRKRALTRTWTGSFLMPQPDGRATA